MNVNWRPYDDLWQLANDPERPRYIFFSFSDYLKTIADFVEKERKKNNQQIEEIEKTIPLEEFQEGGNPSDYYVGLEESFAEFENTLFSSFFVMIYGYMESELIHYCQYLEKRDPQKVELSDLAGKNDVLKSITYLTKVQQLEFSIKNSPMWERIRGFKTLRNYIVHNQGKLDDDNKWNALLKLFKIQFQDEICILDRNFCSDALATMEKFLNSVAAAKKPKVP